MHDNATLSLLFERPLRTAGGRAWSLAKTILRAAAAALLAIALGGCGAPAPQRPNLILIVVDTLRSDHLSVAGYPLETSPRLEDLARRGTFFDRFYAHSAVTRPSVATLFTSRYVSGHNITNQGPAGLSEDLAYLPEILDDAGYATRAFVTNPQLHPLLGFSRGFDQFEELFSSGVDPVRLLPKDLSKRPARDVFSRVRQSLEELDERPFFAYIHLLDPHGPYQPPAEELAKFADPSYRGTITGSIADFARHRQFQENPQDLAHFRALYDAEVSSTDRAVGEFVDWLEQEGLLADTHLLFTADHGEELMEHGETGHSTKLYEESVRIPLLWIGPGVPPGRRVGSLAGLVDVLPTLLDVLELPPPESATFQGRSLRPVWQDDPGGRASRSALFLEGLAKGGPIEGLPRVERGLLTPTHKILAKGCAAGQAGWETLEIFDLEADPGERRGTTVTSSSTALSDEEKQLVRLYQAEVQRILRRSSPSTAPEVELPAEELERLRSLGYLDP